MPYLHRIAVPTGTDKFGHAVIYFVLCWLTRRAFYYQTAIPILRESSFLGAFIFASVYGALDELHQAFVPGLTGSVYDWLADAGGALLYVAIASLVQGRGGGIEADSGS